MERARPSKRSVPAVSLALLPTTRCRSLHRRVSRSFWRGRFGCAAAPAVAMPESDLEVTERVGLDWRKPPCPERSRLDDWFLGVAFAGSQRPAPSASLPDMHEELTGEHVLVRTDSTVTIAYISQLARHLLLWSRKHLRSLRAIHIPGLLNRTADELSRAALPGE